MFFEIDPEMIRKHMDAVRAAKEAQEASAKESPEGGKPGAEEPGLRILQGLDGGIIIDEPSLTSVTGLVDEPWTWEMLDKTSIFVQGVGPSPWVPLSNVRSYVEGMPPRA